MKIFLFVNFITLIALIGCTTQPKKKIEYQNNFYTGCMNAYLYFNKTDKAKISVKIKAGNDWCVKKYESIKDF